MILFLCSDFLPCPGLAHSPWEMKNGFLDTQHKIIKAECFIKPSVEINRRFNKSFRFNHPVQGRPRSDVKASPLEVCMNTEPLEGMNGRKIS